MPFIFGGVHGLGAATELAALDIMDEEELDITDEDALDETDEAELCTEELLELLTDDCEELDTEAELDTDEEVADEELPSFVWATATVAMLSTRAPVSTAETDWKFFMKRKGES